MMFKVRLWKMYIRLHRDIQWLEAMAESCRMIDPEAHDATRYTIMRLGDLTQRMERKFREA